MRNKNSFECLVDEIRTAYQEDKETIAYIGFGDPANKVDISCFAGNIVFLGMEDGSETVGLRAKSDDYEDSKFELEIMMDSPMQVVRIDNGEYMMNSEAGPIYITF